MATPLEWGAMIGAVSSVVGTGASLAKGSPKAGLPQSAPPQLNVQGFAVDPNLGQPQAAVPQLYNAPQAPAPSVPIPQTGVDYERNLMAVLSQLGSMK